jgi:ornithine carbamoyltransferase
MTDRILITNSPAEALKDADFVVTDTWYVTLMRGAFDVISKRSYTFGKQDLNGMGVRERSPSQSL